MENQKDLELLKYSLSLKLEIFNKIRYGYTTLIDETHINEEVIEEVIIEKSPVINTVEKSLENELVLVEEFKEENRNSSERKSAMNISNLGTSYFGRRRR